MPTLVKIMVLEGRQERTHRSISRESIDMSLLLPLGRLNRGGTQPNYGSNGTLMSMVGHNRNRRKKQLESHRATIHKLMKHKDGILLPCDIYIYL